MFALSLLDPPRVTINGQLLRTAGSRRCLPEGRTCWSG